MYTKSLKLATITLIQLGLKVLTNSPRVMENPRDVMDRSSFLASYVDNI